MTNHIGRREFITVFGGAAAAPSILWPLGALGQPPDRVRRIGVLAAYTENDPEGRARLQALDVGLRALGWIDGRNVRIDYRWPNTDLDRTRAFAAELVALAPDVLLATNTTSSQALRDATQIIPIVFVALSDPVGSGIVANLARPEGNITGFTSFEYSLAGKWLRLLRDVAPHITRAAIMFNTRTAPYAPLYLQAAEEAARAFGIKLTAADVQDDREIERFIAELANGADGGLIALPDIFTVSHRGLIIALAAKYRVPAIYPSRNYAVEGGLIAYGPDVYDQFRRTASYVDRILKGAKPTDLPVQVPTKFYLVVNLKTAKALGLTVPEQFLLTADEVIE